MKKAIFTLFSLLLISPMAMASTPKLLEIKGPISTQAVGQTGFIGALVLLTGIFDNTSEESKVVRIAVKECQAKYGSKAAPGEISTDLKMETKTTGEMIITEIQCVEDASVEANCQSDKKKHGLSKSDDFRLWYNDQANRLKVLHEISDDCNIAFMIRHHTHKDIALFSPGGE